MNAQRSDIGVIGLGAMGSNLAMNLADHGFRTAVFNRSPERTESLLSAYRGQSGTIDPSYTIETFLGSLSIPRKIILMVAAGDAVDQTLGKLLPSLDPGDFVIDGGNSHFRDTIRRVELATRSGVHFVGMGISGGEEGARRGPSLMPGVDEGSVGWNALASILPAIAAKDFEGGACVSPIGPDGAGHYVKMVHNGIEYADMQLIAEAYFLMKESLGMDNGRIADVFAGWNDGRLESYLIDITGRILRERESDGGYLVDRILDSAGSKGTGRWTAEEALALGTPSFSIAAAVFARYASSEVGKRRSLSALRAKAGGSPGYSVSDLEQALFAAKLLSYAQGFELLSAAGREHGWNLRFGEIARIWQGGCIIRARFLRELTQAYAGDHTPDNLLSSDFAAHAIRGDLPSLRLVAAAAITEGVPAPGFLSALSYFDSITSMRLPANLIQAQRDFFGAHTFVREEGGAAEHHDWSEHGDTPASSQ